MGCQLSSLASDLKLIIQNGIFLSAYFIPVGLLGSLVAFWRGAVPHWLAGGVFALAALDALIPLPKRPHFNKTYAHAAGLAAGLKSYCDGEVRIAEDFQKDQQYLIGIAPHGLWPMCYHLVWPELIKRYGITPLIIGASIVLKIPFFKRHFAAYGVVAAERKDMAWALQRPYPFNVTVVFPGGIAEMFYGINREQIILKKRKGFVKLALQNGANLVPAYAFGSNQQFRRYFDQDTLFARISSKLQISITPWLDRFFIPFGWVPVRQKVLVAIGKPIYVKKVEKPTDEQVEDLHKKFCDAMKALFDEHKGSLGWEDKKLYLEDESSATLRKQQ